MRKFKVAVVGATGNVGREALMLLAEREFPVSEVVALASKNSLGKEVSFGEKDVLKVQILDDYDFTGTDIAIFSPGASISKVYAPKAAQQGCIVIDNTSYFRMDEDVPLIVPEVNAASIADYKKRYIIANPNCSTIQMVVALKPLHDYAKIKRVVVATYQSVSGAGKEAMDELYNQTKGMFSYQNVENKIFTKQIAFNVIPHIDVFREDGLTKEEWKMVVETQKILDPTIQICASCVRVPSFTGHAEMVNIEFEEELSPEKARAILQKAPGVTVVDGLKNGGYVTPVEIVGEDDVFISRIRRDSSVKYGLNMWVVGDNLRKGAALNAVQIAEALIKNYL